MKLTDELIKYYKMQDKPYKIYCLKHPITLEVRYIGVTSGKLTSRLSQHYHTGKIVGSTPVSKWVKKLIQLNLKPIIELIEEVSEEEWEEKEISYIKEFSIKTRLLNVQKGGTGVIRGKTREEANKNVALAHQKKICQFNLKGELLKVWDSAMEASNYFKAKSTSSITNASSINYRAITAFGYKWQLYTDYIKQIPLKQNKVTKVGKGKVYMFDIDNKIVNIFENSLQASIILDVYSSRIVTCIKNKTATTINNNKVYFSRDPNFKIQ